MCIFSDLSCFIVKERSEKSNLNIIVADHDTGMYNRNIERNIYGHSGPIYVQEEV